MDANTLNTPNLGFQFEVACPVQRPVLTILRRFVVSVAEEMGFTDDDVMKIEMAVDEACSNAFLHAYDEGPLRERGAVQLKLSIGDDSLTIQVVDHGKGMDKTRVGGMHSIKAYQQAGRDSYHGLGLLIMKEFMDDVNLDGDPDRGTLVTLRKFLRPRNRG